MTQEGRGININKEPNKAIPMQNPDNPSQQNEKISQEIVQFQSNSNGMISLTKQEQQK